MTPLKLIGLSGLVLLVASISCQKSNVLVTPPAAITVVHAMAGAGAIVPKIGADTVGQYYIGPTSGTTLLTIAYGASRLYAPLAGDNPLLVSSSYDTTFKVFSGNLKLESNTIYTLFLSGDTTHPDTMLVKENNIPYYDYSDSSAGVRFVNLTIGGKALTVNLLTDSAHTEFPALAYKQITDFKKYVTKASTGTSYTFQIRDQATNDILGTFKWTFRMFRVNTIVIAGLQATTPLKVFAVNHY